MNQQFPVFVIDGSYPIEKRRKQLDDNFKASGVGQGGENLLHDFEVSDKAWLSYRLKGSQIDFADHTGFSTVLGNSVTEAGFMNKSSCISCYGFSISHEQFLLKFP